MLLALEWRSDLEIAGQHGIRRRKYGPKQDGAGHCHPRDTPAEKGDGHDGEQHGDGEKPGRRRPEPKPAELVNPQPVANKTTITTNSAASFHMSGLTVGSIPATMLGNSSDPAIPQAMRSAVAAGGRRMKRWGSL